MDPNTASLGWILLSYHSLFSMVLEQHQQMIGLITRGSRAASIPMGLKPRSCETAKWPLGMQSLSAPLLFA